MIKYSLVVPAYNCENKIKIMLDSIIRNSISYSNFEVIIVDDGSIDKTYNICNQYQKKFEFINVYQKKNGGPNLARKTGFKFSTGKYIIFLDADDFIDDNFFLEIEREISDKVDILEFGFNVLDASLKLKKTSKFYKEEINENILEHYIIQKNTSNFYWNKVIKKSIISEDDFEKLFYSEDYSTLVKLFTKCQKYLNIGKELYNYIIFDDSICSVKFSLKHYDIFKADEIVYEHTLKQSEKNIAYVSISACSHAAKLYTTARLNGNYERKDIEKIKSHFKKFYNIYAKNKFKIDKRNISVKKRISVGIFNISPLLYYLMFKNKVGR